MPGLISFPSDSGSFIPSEAKDQRCFSGRSTLTELIAEDYTVSYPDHASCRLKSVRNKDSIGNLQFKESKEFNARIAGTA
ncbi:MAG: hypothetical protein CW694_01405 [Candidatus Syntrophoarchaeum sp. WYZ-LMO15]|nr:MAG: hypothetical protein CW694_01405 [Candidatus Syntrophoarchaeum sp. WYZ-LMO15]